MKKLLLYLIPPLIFLAGCVHVISDSSLGLVDREMYSYPVIAIKEIYLQKEDREELYESRPMGLYPYWGAYGGF